MAAPVLNTPVGFRPCRQRLREIWTNDEWRIVKRALQVLGGHELATVFRCPHETCRHVPMERLTNEHGELVMRCPHKDRIIRRELPRQGRA